MAKDIKGISDLTPDSKNANKGTERGLGMLEDSLRRYGVSVLQGWRAGSGLAFIYVLLDPHTYKVRYVGKANNPHHRLMVHCWHTRQTRTLHVSRWIARLRKTGDKPLLAVIEQVGERNWRQRERYWVSFFTEKGAQLTNLAVGGNGAPLSISDETRARCSRALKGKRHTQEAKKRISASRKGMVFSEEHRCRLSTRKRKYFSDVANTFALSRYWAKLTDREARQVWAWREQVGSHSGR